MEKLDLPPFITPEPRKLTPVLRPPRKLDRWELEIRAFLQPGCGPLFGKLPGR